MSPAAEAGGSVGRERERPEPQAIFTHVGDYRLREGVRMASETVIQIGGKMSSSRPFTSDEIELNTYVAEFMLKVARPLVWYNPWGPRPKQLFGGTCFMLRFDTGIIGITANHVIEAFEEALKEQKNIVCLLRTVLFDIQSAIIGRDAELDIATFRVTEDQLIASEAEAIDCRSNWPPPIPDIGAAISLAGFPELLKKIIFNHNVEFRAYVNMAFVEDINTKDIIVTYEPERDIRIRSAPELPALGANLSGCSGGPVLMHVIRNGLFRWFPVGIIIAGSGANSEGSMAEFDIIRVRRVNTICPDGTIDR